MPQMATIELMSFSFNPVNQFASSSPGELAMKTYSGDSGPEPGSCDSGCFREEAETALRLIVSGKLNPRMYP
jgi:hypothetical protein